MQKKIFLKERTKKCLGKDEFSKLKILNFTIENEIKKIDFLLNYKMNMNKYLSIVNIFPEQNRELEYNNQKKDNQEIEEIFNLQKKFVEQKYNQILIENNLQESEIEKYNNAINLIKQNIKIKKIVSSSNIIYEKSLENKSINSFSNSCNFNSKIFYEMNEDNKRNVYINNNNLTNVVNFKFNINLNINN